MWIQCGTVDVWNVLHQLRLVVEIPWFTWVFIHPTGGCLGFFPSESSGISFKSLIIFSWQRGWKMSFASFHEVKSLGCFWSVIPWGGPSFVKTSPSCWLEKNATLPETNSSHLNMDDWKTTFLLGWPIFRGYVKLRECSPFTNPLFLFPVYCLWSFPLAPPHEVETQHQFQAINLGSWGHPSRMIHFLRRFRSWNLMIWCTPRAGTLAKNLLPHVCLRLGKFGD